MKKKPEQPPVPDSSEMLPEYWENQDKRGYEIVPGSEELQAVFTLRDGSKRIIHIKLEDENRG